MSSDRTVRRVLALALTCAACIGSEGGDLTPVVALVEPACGDSAQRTAVIVRGSLPASVVVSLSDPADDALDTRYRAWIGDLELADVRWASPAALAAMIPSGLPAGTYAVTVEGPTGLRGTLQGAFEVRAGACPVQTASLVIVSPVAAPATSTVGQDVTVTATVENHGGALASGVVAAITSTPSGFAPKGTAPGPQDVPPGQGRTFTWVYTSSAPGGGVFVVDAGGTAADTGLPATATSVSTNAVLVNPGTFLTANTDASPAKATVGQVVTVVIIAENHSTTAALVTPAIVVIGPVTPGASPSAKVIPAGSWSTFQWTFTASAAGLATFTASVSSTDPVTSEPVTVPTAPCDVTVQARPALTAALAIPATLELGDFTVTMTVSNTGGDGAATAVGVVPDPPAVQAGSTALAVLASGPTGSPAAEVIAGQPAVTFTWVFTATAPGTLTLGSAARGTDANTGLAVASPAAISNAASVGLHSVGGTVTGLAGSGLVLQNGSDGLAISADGPFTFPTAVASGGAYAVTVRTQPANPTQSCAVANGTGTIGGANVTNVAVTCTTTTFTVGGSVTGLQGTGLVLRNGTDTLAVSANGAFTFPTPVASGRAYAVTVTTQPANPTQTCTVTNGSGTVGGANVTNVAVSCATTTFTVGGTVTGLAGSGLVLRNGGDTLPIPANGTFTFPTPVASGGAYVVTVTAQPANPTQTCTVANGSGAVAGANVTDVAVTCATAAFTVGGAVTGLAGSGLVLHNGSDALPVSADGPFTFPTAVASGASYAVTVTAQPSNPTQTCTVTHGSGTVGSANVTDVAVACATATFTIGGSVSGLAGRGLVLQNGSDSLPVSANGPFRFPTAVASGGAYAVTVTTQPADPTQTCTVANGSGTIGTANVTNVAVTCATAAFTVGGTVAGLAGSGLVLHNGSDSLAISANGPFTFPTAVASGASYAVTVTAQPASPTQACTVTRGSGTVGGADVTDVAVSCVTSSFRVGGTVAGLAGDAVTVQNGGDTLRISRDGPFRFPTEVASGQAYAVGVTAQPTNPWQTCTVADPTGIVGAADVTSVVVTCTTDRFTLGGTVGGLLGEGLVLQNGVDTLPVPAGATAFTFPAPIESGQHYHVTVAAQPGGQSCSVADGSGTIAGANVTSVSVSCTP